LENLRRLALLLAAYAAFGQSPPAFDVASVKRQPWNSEGGSSLGVFLRGDTLDAEHCSLYDLISWAYGLRDGNLSGGPVWANRDKLLMIDAELYQVIGKVSANPPPSAEAFRQMLQMLLADRFQLKIHHVEKELPAYNLVIDKGGGLKMTLSAPGTSFSNNQRSIGRYAIRMVTSQLTMQDFAGMIAGYAGRPVFDKTGLAGGYDFRLDFIPESVTAETDLPPGVQPISQAVREQLGLRLEASTGMFDTVVIDHAERPASN
jgi:uncharacterized protein (TIGR03435 family)